MDYIGSSRPHKCGTSFKKKTRTSPNLTWDILLLAHMGLCLLYEHRPDDYIPYLFQTCERETEGLDIMRSLGQLKLHKLL